MRDVLRLVHEACTLNYVLGKHAQSDLPLCLLLYCRQGAWSSLLTVKHKDLGAVMRGCEIHASSQRIARYPMRLNYCSFFTSVSLLLTPTYLRLATTLRSSILVNLFRVLDLATGMNPTIEYRWDG